MLLTLAPDPDAPRRARCFVASALPADTAQAVIEAAMLFTSELVVRLDVSDDLLRVAVLDESPVLPELRRPARDHPHGRGLALVQALAASWGAGVEREGGKAVWFELAVQRHVPGAQGSSHLVPACPRPG